MPVSVDTWGPFVFANLEAGTPLSRVLGELPAIIGRSGLRLDDLRFSGREEWTAGANWKVMIENFLECYHCPVQHPGFSAVVDVAEESYGLHAHEWFSSQVAPVRASALEGRGRKTAYDVHGAVTQAQYHYLWPSLTISINPGHPNLSLDVWMPDGPDRTRGFSEHYFGADVPGPRPPGHHRIQSPGRPRGRRPDGLGAARPSRRPARPGRLLTASEHLVIHFQKLVLSALG